MHMKKIDGSDFRKWRTQHGLTQSQAAELIGVAVDTVRGWEQGRRSPPNYVALLIERLKPSDYPKITGSSGNRPVGVATKIRRARKEL
ncbi:MAG: helix-turn-helix domain-containing protein [Alphaproteobacteria bacterium]|jgi:transcriptional regulator with XRE-family HTH domain|uniref:Helix-turn-helix domain-containing protein n=1 Tax=Microcystis aeruginosa Ma_OC_H_19870700_S124 TaxID=2486262 RepID=A0A552A851_MICAE|nr:helix-turn-helix domain-containing protein [Alphaproteobacteria bacterium]TRT81635.1 MAG: helix-turn-helix domain-containing protein [Microcystis aeruginosa Ma_OC_H_19870700_S124]